MKLFVYKTFKCKRDNTEKIWAHRFLAKPKTMKAGGLWGVVNPQGVQSDALVNVWMQIS